MNYRSYFFKYSIVFTKKGSVTEKYYTYSLFKINPERGSGKTKMTNGSFGKKMPATGSDR